LITWFVVVLTVDSRLSQKNARLMRPTLFNYISTPQEFQKHVSSVWNFIEKGLHDAPVHETYPLKDVARAHNDLEGRKTTGKLLLKP
jgi:NADPH2:quinone reductase